LQIRQNSESITRSVAGAYEEITSRRRICREQIASARCLRCTSMNGGLRREREKELDSLTFTCFRESSFFSLSRREMRAGLCTYRNVLGSSVHHRKLTSLSLSFWIVSVNWSRELYLCLMRTQMVRRQRFFRDY